MFSGELIKNALFSFSGKDEVRGCRVAFCNLAANKMRVTAHKGGERGGLSAGRSGYMGLGFETCVLPVCARQWWHRARVQSG